MDNDTLEAIGDSLGNVAAVFAERRRQGHPSHGGAASFPFFDECLTNEAKRLRGLGQDLLADGLLGLLSAA